MRGHRCVLVLKLFGLLHIAFIALLLFLGGRVLCAQDVLQQDNKAQILSDFYNECFVTRYGRVRKICKKMLTMPAPVCAQALKMFVDILTHTPWLYFVNKREEFKSKYYWEHIIDQCAIMNYFLKTARVRLDNKTLFIPPYGQMYWKTTQQYKNTQPLLEYFRRHHKPVIGCFYALIFDYAIKLFNEAILLKSQRQVSRCYVILEYAMDKLRGTDYEADYQESLNICKELTQLLKHMMGTDSLASFERNFVGNNREKQMYKEMYQLKNR